MDIKKKEDRLIDLYNKLIEKELASIESNEIKMGNAQEDIKKWQDENNESREEVASLTERRNAVQESLDELE